MTPGGKPAPSFTWPDRLCDPVRSLPDHQRLWVAFSGGLDSTVLLHLVHHCHHRTAPVRAIHINHQLQPNADQTERFCRRECQALDIPLTVERVTVPVPAEGVGGIEEAARHARYQVFEALLAPGDLLLMAHHADDQVETVLFRLLRGSGVRGLGGMPRQRRLGRGRLVRPLLMLDRAELDAWARSVGLSWVDDPSNQDPRFDRNYLRQAVTPELRKRWPGLNRRVLQSASACADSAQLSERLAELQWRDCGDDQGRLRVVSLAALSVPEQKNLVAWWIGRAGYPLPARRDWAQVLGELLTAGEDRQPELAGDGFCVRRYRGYLYLVPDGEIPEPMCLTPVSGQDIRWGSWCLTWCAAASEKNAPPAIRISTRQGGERFRPCPGGSSRPVKKWLQEQGVPPWERARIPLVFAASDRAESLIAIGDLWCSEQYSGSAPAAGWRLVVRRDCD